MKTSSVFVSSGRLCPLFFLKTFGILWADEGSSGIVFTGRRSVEQAQQVSTHLRIFLLVGISQTLMRKVGGTWRIENGIFR